MAEEILVPRDTDTREAWRVLESWELGIRCGWFTEDQGPVGEVVLS